jgi:hypothetical protein
MSLRRQIEDAFLAQFVDNERLLTAARNGDLDPALVERYEARQVALKPIVTGIVVDRRGPARKTG